MKPVQEKWDTIKNAVITDYGISPIAVKLWIDPMEYFSETDDTVTIILPNDKANIIDLLTDKYREFFIIAIYETMNMKSNLLPMKRNLRKKAIIKKQFRKKNPQIQVS